jgi:hypothetical protein
MTLLLQPQVGSTSLSVTSCTGGGGQQRWARQPVLMVPHALPEPAGVDVNVFKVEEY